MTSLFVRFPSRSLKMFSDFLHSGVHHAENFQQSSWLLSWAVSQIENVPYVQKYSLNKKIQKTDTQKHLADNFL